MFFFINSHVILNNFHHISSTFRLFCNFQNFFIIFTNFLNTLKCILSISSDFHDGEMNFCVTLNFYQLTNILYFIRYNLQTIFKHIYDFLNNNYDVETTSRHTSSQNIKFLWPIPIFRSFHHLRPHNSHFTCKKFLFFASTKQTLFQFRLKIQSIFISRKK